MAEKKIDAKFLEGLKFTGSQAKKMKVDGVEKTRYVPFERDLTPGDVLDWTDKVASVTIVTADGRKYVVSKAAKKEEGKKEGSK